MKLKEIKNIEEYKLCYVANNMAWFTRLSVNEQDGDGWNEYPYEHNAGEPFNDEGADLLRVCYNAPDLHTPGYNYYNSPYSVVDINNGAVAWLYGGKGIAMPAGTGVIEFIEKVQKSGGSVFMEIEL